MKEWDNIIIDNRYTIYRADGVIYDCEGKDIPWHIFEIRDLLIKQSEEKQDE